MGQIFTRPLRKTKKTIEHAALRKEGRERVEEQQDDFDVLEHVDKDGVLCRRRVCKGKRGEVEGAK